MAECATDCPYIVGLYERSRAISLSVNDILKHACGMSKLMYMTDVERDTTLEVFNNDQRAAAHFLSDEIVTLSDVIEVIPDEAKAEYEGLESMRMYAAMSAIDNSEIAMSACIHGSPGDSEIDGQKYIVCRSKVVAQTLVEAPFNPLEQD